MALARGVGGESVPVRVSPRQWKLNEDKRGQATVNITGDTGPARTMASTGTGRAGNGVPGVLACPPRQAALYGRPLRAGHAACGACGMH